MPVGLLSSRTDEGEALKKMQSEKTRISGHKDSVVLIYSSDQDFLDYYRAMFVSLGLTPIAATTSESALGLLRLTVVAFVVVDQDDGPQECGQVIRHAREAEYQSTVVVVSRRNHRNPHHEAARFGTAERVDHPAPADDMLDALLPNRAQARRSSF